jgi:hypothetical protein
MFAALLLTGCMDVKVSDSHHTVGGEATVRIVVGVDVTACEGLEPAAKAECVQSLIELAKLITEQQDEEQLEGFGGI